MSTRPVAIVTGSTGTFGKHIASGLLAAGFETVCIGRDAKKGEELLSLLRARHPKGVMSYEMVDCASYNAIRAFATKWKEQGGGRPLSVLVNNAAVVPKVRGESVEGVELQWACNVLGYHWFVREMLPFLRLASAPRVVNVASRYTGGLNLQDPEFRKRPYDADAAYRQSKQANRMQAKQWAKILGTPFVVTSCHPGVAASGVADGLGFAFDDSESTAAQGSVTPLFCALDPSVESGAWYVDRRKESCPYGANDAQCDALWEVLERYSSAAEARR